MGVLVKLDNGDTFNIEMQKIYDKNAEKKNLMYVAGLFYSQLKSGETYDKVKKTIGINFVKDLILHRRDRIIQRYIMTNEEEPEDKMLPELFNVLVINVDRKEDQSYNRISETFEEWRQFIGAETIEELEKLAENNSILKEALEESVRFMSEEYVQDYSREEALIKSQMDSMKEEGQKEERLEIAIKMIKKDYSLKDIQELTSLSMEELEKLKEESK